MDPSGNGQYWTQTSKRRRLNYPPNGWQPVDDEDNQAPLPWLPAPALDRHLSNRPWESYNLPSVQKPAAITSSVDFAASYGEQLPRHSLPTPSDQAGYTYFARALPPLPTLEPTHYSWPSTYGGAAPLPMDDQTSRQHSGAQLGGTSHDATLLLPPPSTFMTVSSPAAVHNSPKRDTEPKYSSSISGPKQKDTTIPTVVCFGMVSEKPFPIQSFKPLTYHYRSNQSRENVTGICSQQPSARF